MAAVLIAVGSNIEPGSNIPRALRLLASAVRVIAISTFYRTEPIGLPGSPPFYNGVVKLETEIAPRELKLDVLRGIERQLGRVRGPDKYAPRPIDLDIAAYGGLLINEPDLVVPDPDILSRPFVAVPIFELDPDFVLPDSDVTIAEVVASLPVGSMQPLTEFTQALRREIEHEP